jgi:tetratricopeptide (TPR) repeat protein
LAYLDLMLEAQLHREVYVAVLDSLLQERGSKRHLANVVGITPQYLSYVCVLDQDPADLRAVSRTPSLAVAERIVRALPLPLEQRESLLEHMTLACERRLQAHESLQLRWADTTVDELVGELQRMHHRATFAQDLGSSRAEYRAIQEATGIILCRLDLRRQPFALASLCLIRSSVQCVLDRADDALWNAKLARAALSNLSLAIERQDGAKAEDLFVNAMQAEAVAYHNLGLFREAYRCCARAEASPAIGGRLDRWKPHLYRDKLNALSEIPRFAISEAMGLVDQVRAVCERGIYSDEENDLLLVMMHRSLAQAYLQRGDCAKAEGILQAEIDRMDGLAHIGALHRTLLWQTYARLCWERGSPSRWQNAIRRAWAIAHQAGLAHQLRCMQCEHGETLAMALSGHV